MIGGKRTNIVERGGYVRRVHATTFAFQHGGGWFCDTFRRVTGNSPSQLWKKSYAVGMRSKEYSKPRKRIRVKRPLVADRPKDEFFSRIRKPKGNRFYGPCANDVDIREDEMKRRVDNLRASLHVSTLEIRDKLMLSTVLQWNSRQFRERHKNMITASMCGRIFKCRDRFCGMDKG